MAVTIAAGCFGGPASAPTTPRHGGGRMPGLVGPPSHIVDWSADFGPGSRRVSLGQAASLLAFAPAVPESGPFPAVIYVSDPRQPTARRALELQFQDSAYGRFRLDESVAQASPAVLLSQAMRCTGGGLPAKCPSSTRIAHLGRGVRGLLIVGSATTGVEWIVRGVLYDIYGPPRTFTARDAVAIARRVLHALDRASVRRAGRVRTPPESLVHILTAIGVREPRRRPMPLS